MAEPFPLVPDEVMPRGEFPEHPDEIPVRPVRTAEEARAYARARLEAWRETHPNG